MRIMMIAAAASLALGSALAQPAPPTTPAPSANPESSVTAPAANTPETNPPVENQNAIPDRSTQPSNPAVKTTQGNNPGAPAVGANSFTEGQAKSRIESRGYTNVSGLTKDASGIWRGMAQKDGKPVQVALDFQGNVVPD